ncbi:Aluminum-activated malate transporter [Sesbania bispinosa]|nr:Aluminum-activated malate transporter [Sesbania bispinosa]
MLEPLFNGIGQSAIWAVMTVVVVLEFTTGKGNFMQRAQQRIGDNSHNTFKHLEEAYEKLQGQFKSSKKEWEMEKSTLLDDISSMQIKLDSQIRIQRIYNFS